MNLIRFGNFLKLLSCLLLQLNELYSKMEFFIFFLDPYVVYICVLMGELKLGGFIL